MRNIFIAVQHGFEHVDASGRGPYPERLAIDVGLLDLFRHLDCSLGHVVGLFGTQHGGSQRGACLFGRVQLHPYLHRAPALLLPSHDAQREEALAERGQVRVQGQVVRVRAEGICASPVHRRCRLIQSQRGTRRQKPFTLTLRFGKPPPSKADRGSCKIGS